MVTEQEVEAVGRTLVDVKQPLHVRFRALFTLRGLGGPDAITWISRAFDDDSALLKHELAYCLGQMQDARAIPALVAVLRDSNQEPMVRHEAGEWPVGLWTETPEPTSQAYPPPLFQSSPHPKLYPVLLKACAIAGYVQLASVWLLSQMQLCGSGLGS